MLLYIIFLLIFGALAIRDVIYKILVHKASPESIVLLFIVTNIFVGLFLYIFVFERAKIHNDFNNLLTIENAPLIIFSSIVGLTFTYYYYTIIKTEKLYFVNLIFVMYPVFIAIAAYYFLNQKITINEIFAMIVIITGAIMLNYFKS